MAEKKTDEKTTPAAPARQRPPQRMKRIDGDDSPDLDWTGIEPITSTAGNGPLNVGAVTIRALDIVVDEARNVVTKFGPRCRLLAHRADDEAVPTISEDGVLAQSVAFGQWIALRFVGALAPFAGRNDGTYVRIIRTETIALDRKGKPETEIRYSAEVPD